MKYTWRQNVSGSRLHGSGVNGRDQEKKTHNSSCAGAAKQVGQAQSPGGDSHTSQHQRVRSVHFSVTIIQRGYLHT